MRIDVDIIIVKYHLFVSSRVLVSCCMSAMRIGSGIRYVTIFSVIVTPTEFQL